jgi:hypothetical protein
MSLVLLVAIPPADILLLFALLISASFPKFHLSPPLKVHDSKFVSWTFSLS